MCHSFVSGVDFKTPCHEGLKVISSEPHRKWQFHVAFRIQCWVQKPLSWRHCLKLRSSDNGKALCLSARALLYSSSSLSCLKSNPLSLTLPNRPPILSEGQVFLLAWCHLWSGNGEVGRQAKIKWLKLQILSTVPWLYPRTPYIQKVCLDFVFPYLSKSNLLCHTTKFWSQPYSATSCLELTHLMPCNMSENVIDGDWWQCCQKARRLRMTDVNLGLFKPNSFSKEGRWSTLSKVSMLKKSKQLGSFQNLVAPVLKRGEDQYFSLYVVSMSDSRSIYHFTAFNWPNY